MVFKFYKFGRIGYNALTQAEIAATRGITMGVRQGSMSTLRGSFGHGAFIATGLVYTAVAGLNYRRYHKGYIDKTEFWKRMRVNTVTTAGGFLGGTGGAAAGFAIGTYIFPGVGSFLGAVIGGTAGGMVAENFTQLAYEPLDQRIEESLKQSEKWEKLTEEYH